MLVSAQVPVVLGALLGCDVFWTEDEPPRGTDCDWTIAGFCERDLGGPCPTVDELLGPDCCARICDNSTVVTCAGGARPGTYVFDAHGSMIGVELAGDAQEGCGGTMRGVVYGERAVCEGCSLWAPLTYSSVSCADEQALHVDAWTDGWTSNVLVVMSDLSGRAPYTEQHAVPLVGSGGDAAVDGWAHHQLSLSTSAGATWVADTSTAFTCAQTPSWVLRSYADDGRFADCSYGGPDGEALVRAIEQGGGRFRESGVTDPGSVTTLACEPGHPRPTR